MNKLIESIKKNEGFKGMPYNDSRGYPTIGFGTLLPLNEEEAELLLQYRLSNIEDEIKEKVPYFDILPPVVKEVLFEMGYQLGVPKMMKFKQMFAAIKDGDWEGMIREMKDSRWYKQTPNRVNVLTKKIKDNLL
jgi:lysozyme